MSNGVRAEQLGDSNERLVKGQKKDRKGKKRIYFKMKISAAHELKFFVTTIHVFLTSLH